MKAYAGDLKIDFDDDVFTAIYSTVLLRAPEIVSNVGDAMDFLQSGFCSAEIARSVKKQFKLIKKYLSKIPAKKAIHNYMKPKKAYHWDIENIEEISCADLFKTTEGENALDKIIELMEYAADNGTDIKKIS